MHLGILSGLILALAGSLWGGASTHAGDAAYRTNTQAAAALYSVMAQGAVTPTVDTGITPTVAVTGTVQAATTVTATAATTTTTGITPSVPPSTPIPIPTAVTQANLQINPFDWNFLSSWPTEPKLGPFAIAFLALMLLLIGASVYFLRFRQPEWKTTNPVLFKAVNRFAIPALWIGVLGILFLICRIIPIDGLNLRFWLYLDFLALLGLAGWMIYWYRTSYPKEIARFRKTQKARQYMPGGSGKIATRSTPVTTPPKGGQQPRQGGQGAQGKAAPPPSRPAQQSSKNRKRK